MEDADDYKYLRKQDAISSIGQNVSLVAIALMMRHSVIFNKKLYSFALYEGSHGKGFFPYQVSANFRPTDRDKKFVAKLTNSLVNSLVVSGALVWTKSYDCRANMQAKQVSGHFQLTKMETNS